MVFSIAGVVAMLTQREQSSASVAIGQNESSVLKRKTLGC